MDRENYSPSVSVLMAVYNYEGFISESIESILSQSFTDFEFVIVDDASTDNTANIIKSYKDPRIVFIQNQENIGQTRSLNKGLKVAKGKYIARIDGDDIALENRLSKQVEFLDRNPAVGVVGAWLEAIDENNKLIRRSKYPILPNVLRLLILNILHWPCLTHPSVMIRKDALDDVGFYDEKYSISQDYDLWLRITRKYLARNIPEVLMRYREHSSSLSRKKKEKTRAEVRDIIGKNVKYYLPNIDLYKKTSLVDFLMFDKQTYPKQAKELLKIVDEFFNAIKEKNNGLAIPAREYNYLKDMAVVFYLSRLFITNPGLSLSIIARFFKRWWRWIFSRQFFYVFGHAVAR